MTRTYLILSICLHGPLPCQWLCFLPGPKIQNPALYLFRVTGFWVLTNHFKASFLSGLKEETCSGILLNAVYT